MYTLVIVLTVIVAILLIGVVLVQKSKGGGLASGFSGANQIMGVRHTNDFIEKTTWVLAGIVAVLAVISVFVMPKASTSGSRVKAPVEQAAPVQNAPNANTGDQGGNTGDQGGNTGDQGGNTGDQGGNTQSQPAANGEGQGAVSAPAANGEGQGAVSAPAANGEGQGTASQPQPTAGEE